MEPYTFPEPFSLNKNFPITAFYGPENKISAIRYTHNNLSGQIPHEWRVSRMNLQHGYISSPMYGTKPMHPHRHLYLSAIERVEIASQRSLGSRYFFCFFIAACCPT